MNQEHIITEAAALFADVILPLNITPTLTYGVPFEWKDRLQVGMRVEVALGKNKIYTGIVSNIHPNKPEQFAIKPIKKIMDAQPIINAKQLAFWQWVSSYYAATPGEVMQAALPAHLKPSSQISVAWSGLEPQEVPALSDAAFVAAEALQIKKDLTLPALREITGDTDFNSVLEELLLHKIAFINDALETPYQPKLEKYVYLDSYYKEDAAMHQLFDQLAKAPKQLQILMRFLELQKKQEAVPQKLLLQKAEATSAQLKTLIDKNVLVVQEHEIDRLPSTLNDTPLSYTLSPAQQMALAHVNEAWGQHEVVLLQGVTGSGKTLLYIELIKDALAQGKQVLMLLPEIALTTHLVQRLQEYFTDSLGVYHSRFSNNERVEIWEKVRLQQYQVVVGPRSALWLPFDHLGLIIVDEEHDSAYKQQDPAPRFNARDAAIRLASLYTDAKVLLGSATPSIESLYNVQEKKYGYAALQERYQQTPLPTIELVPAKSMDALRSKGIRTMTPALLAAIAEALEAHEQVILFQNRRGYAPFQICSVCGWVPHCKNCAVSLTYHRSSDSLRCHYCGLKAAPVQACAACGSHRIHSRTFGTEKVEEEIKSLFPKARVARMDVDSMRGKNSAQQLMQRLSQHQIDILIGTQMVVKGLDFKKVGLVGIISADNLLSYPDFRVNERAFQLMEQVSGRAGRDEKQGKVLIQVYKEEHAVLQWVQQHNVRAYYLHEINFRKLFHYPPYVRLIKVIVKHTQETKAHAAAVAMLEGIQNIHGVQALGPNPALVARVRNQYIFEITIKMQRQASVLTATKQYLLLQKENVSGRRGNSGVQIIIDVDPS